MAVLLKKNISVNRIITIGIEHAKAVDDPLRVKILQILYNKQLDAYRITQHLKKFGHKKALTTIRHHLDILKTAGLIEIVKIEESRGAIIKYYGTSAKFLEFDLPGDFNSRYASIIKSTSLKPVSYTHLTLPTNREV